MKWSGRGMTGSSDELRSMYTALCRVNLVGAELLGVTANHSAAMLGQTVRYWSVGRRAR